MCRVSLLAIVLFSLSSHLALAEEKLPVPDDTAQKQAASLVADLFRADYEAAKTLEQKSELAKKMLQVGVDSKDDPTGRYVLLRIARDIAAGAGDIKTTMASVEQLISYYKVDDLAMQAEVLAKLVKTLRLPKDHQELGSQLQRSVRDAIVQDNFELAKVINATALDSARQARSSELVKQAVAQAKEIESLEAEFKKVLVAHETLKSSPTDPESNLLVGKYRCFVKRDWENGLLMLALGSDKQLKQLAEAELGEKPDAISLGDLWWALSEEQESQDKQAIQDRACMWYRKALPTATGLTKAKLEQRLGSVKDASATSNAGPFSIEVTEELASIKYQGERFTDYHFKQGSKPFLWPVIGPSGEPLTRSFPMEKVPGEDNSHPHHRSIWFGHGDVNGINFWNESTPTSGRIQHRRFIRNEGGEEAILTSINDWIAPNEQVLCEEFRTLTFRAGAGWHAIDFDIEIKAKASRVIFNDTREGGLGIRVATSISPSKSQQAQLVTSEGHRGDSAWGKQASWVDFNGPIAGKTVGIAVFNHPDSFRAPTYWNARTYGLLSSSVFGIREFSGNKQIDGSVVLPSGKSIQLRYRIVLHLGDEREADLAQLFQNYSKQ